MPDDPMPEESGSESESEQAETPSADLGDRVDEALRAMWRGDAADLERLARSEEATTSASGGILRGLIDEAAKGPACPASIGGYRIKRVLGSGGMGTVYLAVQEHPRRTVALKVMRAGIASRSAMRRFQYESQILARLRHPNIAQVFDAGTHDDGTGAVPFFALEYVPNAKGITEYARAKGLSARERLALFAKVCDAIHHGHQKGIIHRDLKPGNILVDSEGEPKIIDFGVARATDSDMALTTLQTDIGQLIGTLQYMSPEQCDADPHDLDVRSDVYALGVVLYELLCDRLPYDATKVAIHEAARVIRETAPVRPSTINRALRGDAETVVLKALEKDRRRRYRSAAELGDDLARYLRHEPIIARRPTAAYHFWKFIERNRVPVTVTAVILLLLIVAVGAVSGMVRQVRRSAELARLLETDSSAEGDLAGSVEDRLLLMRMADEVISVDFDHTPLEAAIATVGDSADLPIQVDWPALAGIGVQPTDTITLRLSGASAVTVLELMLDRAGDVIDPPSYVVRDGQILITSDQAIRRLTVTVTYDVNDLLREQVAGRGTREDHIERLIDVIRENIDPAGWRDYGGETGSIDEFNDKLVVLQTRRNHRAIKRLLRQLREAGEPAAMSPDQMTALMLVPKWTLGESPADRAVLSKLTGSRMPIDYEGTSLSAVLQDFRETLGISIDVDWQALAACGVRPNDPITLHFASITPAEALDVILARLGEDVGVVAHEIIGGSVIVSTFEILGVFTTTMVYDVADLLAAEGLWRWRSRTERERLDRLVWILMEHIDSEGWVDLGGDTSRLTNYGTRLIITTTPSIHRAIQLLLERLRESAAEDALSPDVRRLMERESREVDP